MKLVCSLPAISRGRWANHHRVPLMTVPCCLAIRGFKSVIAAAASLALTTSLGWRGARGTDRLGAAQVDIGNGRAAKMHMMASSSRPTLSGSDHHRRRRLPIAGWGRRDRRLEIAGARWSSVAEGLPASIMVRPSPSPPSGSSAPSRDTVAPPEAPSP
jgi:hypothetical protein